MSQDDEGLLIQSQSDFNRTATNAISEICEEVYMLNEITTAHVMMLADVEARLKRLEEKQ